MEHHLSALVVQHNGAISDSSIANKWARCIHSAFYGEYSITQGSNKFSELEMALTQTFSGLSEENESDFWELVVLVILRLAEKLPHIETRPIARKGEKAVAAAGTTSPKDRKYKKKGSQPNTPLAFMVINALRKVTEGKNGLRQLRQCQAQGQKHELLKGFCVRGLQDPNFVDQKLVVEVLALFAITNIDPEVVKGAAQSLLAAKKYTALIKLLAIYDSLEWSYESMIKTMAKFRDWSAAELFAKTFGREGDKELAKLLVNEAIAIQDVKRAHRIVYSFDLQEEYPDIDLLYCHDGLLKLIERQRWQMALSFAGNDSTLQKLLFDRMMAVGEFQWAARLAQILDVSNFENQVEEIAAQRSMLRTSGLSHAAHAAALNGCLALELSDDSVVFCDTEESLYGAMDHFFDDFRSVGSEKVQSSTKFNVDQVVGLDVEWKPTSSKIAAAAGSTMTAAMASILQIASSSRVFIIDLITLHDSDVLFTTFLERLFTSSFLLKVGFGFDTDLKVLHQTFPERSVLKNIHPFLELSTVVSKQLGVSVGNSLTNATSIILGSPLDKRMQMSNWDVRPLTTSQVTYAALDAYCLVQMTNKLSRNEDATLPSWQNTAAEIQELTYSSPLTDEEALDAIALRKQYYRDWMQSRMLAKSGDVVGSLLTQQDVEDYWEQRKVVHRGREFERLHAGDGTADDFIDTSLTFLDPHTVERLRKQSQDSGQPVAFVAVNAICFYANDDPCVACIEANCKLDTAQLAALCGVSRRRIKLATRAECCESFGFEPGTLPPFGHRSTRATTEQSDDTHIRIYVNNTLRSVESLVCGGGSHDALLWLNTKAYFALIDIEAVGDIQRGFSAVEASSSAKERTSTFQNATSTACREDQEPIREYKFLADSMVARVGKWLRTIGMDVIIWDPYSVAKKSASQDHKAALLALSACDQRILLTRDKKLANRRDAGACFVVASDDPFKQFQEIKTHFALKLVKDEMMSRCSRCNAKGFDVVDLDYVRKQSEDEVHPNVLELVTEFWVCRVCHKIYWEGPKYDSNYSNLLRMFDKDSIVDSVSCARTSCVTKK